MLDKQFGVTKKLGELCDEGLDRLKELEKQGAAAWHRLENSQAIRDLSKGAHDAASWIESEASSVQWAFGFL